jgi:hypothetical protein
MTHARCPIWHVHQQGIERGIARFVDEGSGVSIKEPLALVGIGHYLKFYRRTLEDGIQSLGDMNFKEAILFSLTQIFRRGAHLDDIFQFHGNTPAWASQTARIVGPEESDPAILSAGVVSYAKDTKDIQRWIEAKQSGWCVPGEDISLDLLTWLRLEDGQMLLLAIQTNARPRVSLMRVKSSATARLANLWSSE